MTLLPTIPDTVIPLARQSLSSQRVSSGIVALFTGMIAFSVYLSTMPSRLTWANFGGDSPELITAALTLGVAHPPGYPTYILFGKLVGQIRFIPTAAVFNLVSVLSMSVSVTLVTHLLARNATGKSHTRSELVAVMVSGLTLTLIPLVWSQAVIAEVYAPNLLCLSLLLWLIQPWQKQRSWLIGFVFGLSITIHLTSLFFLPIVLLHTSKNTWPRIAVGTLLGLSPFLALPFLAKSSSPAIWGKPDTFDGFWAIVTASIYRPNVMSFPIQSWPSRSFTWLTEHIGIIWPIWTLSIAIGFRHCFVESRKKALIITITAIGYVIYGLGYASIDAQVFVLPAVLLCTLIVAKGYSRLGAIVLLLPVLMLTTTFQSLSQNKANDRAQELINVLDAVAPAESLVLTNGDQAAATIWFYQHTETWRPDLIIVDGVLFQFDWYRERIAGRYPGLHVPDGDDLAEFRQVNSKTRPLCEVLSANDAEVRCGDSVTEIARSLTFAGQN